MPRKVLEEFGQAKKFEQGVKQAQCLLPDGWMTGQMDEMMLHIPTSFTICNSMI